jgi:stage IV sporulation protein FB
MDFSRVHLMGKNIRARLYLYETIDNLLFVNFYWSLINLLPVYPLDGGQILRACLEHRSGTSGRTRALQISIGVAARIAALAFVSGQMHLVYMFGFLAAGTVQALYGRQTPCNDG